MGRSMLRAPVRLLMAAIAVCLGVGEGIASAGQGGNVPEKQVQPPNLLEAMQEKAAAKRAAEGMMRGVTNRQRWAVAARHADARAQVVRVNQAKGALPPGQRGGGK
jgi:hypothetical protein